MKNEVLEWAKLNGLLFWRIVDKNTGNPVARFDDEAGDLATSLDFLAQNINFLKDGKYSLFGRKHPKATAAELEYQFTLGNQKEIAGAYGNSEIGYIMQIESLKRELDKKEMEFQMKLLQMKMKAEGEKEDMLDKVSRLFELLQKSEKPAEIAGTPTQELSKEQEKLSQNLEKLSKHLSVEELITLTGNLAALLALNADLVKDSLRKNKLL